MATRWGITESVALTVGREPEPDQQIVERRSGGRSFRQPAVAVGLFQFGLEPLVLAPVELDVAFGEEGRLRTRELAGDQVVDVREPGVLVEPHEVRLDLARPHQVDAGQQDAVNIQQRLDPRRMSLANSRHWASANPR